LSRLLSIGFHYLYIAQFTHSKDRKFRADRRQSLITDYSARART
jgi:hypothetical protein